MAAAKKNLLRLVPPPERPGALSQALVELYKAVKGAGFYPEGHPQRDDTLRRAYRLMRELLADQELHLGVTPQGFLCVGERIEGRPMVQQFARECGSRRIASITFMQDLDLDDLGWFVRLLILDPQQGAQQGGMARLLEEFGVRSIWVNEKDLASIWAKRDRYEELLQDEAAAAAEEAADHVGGRDAAELLRLMAQEKQDPRYQELGRALTTRVRGGEESIPVLEVLEELLRQHREPDRSLPQREYALFALEHVADGAADRLLEALEDRECESREAIHRVVAALGTKGAYWVIQRISLAQGIAERRLLAAALVAIGNPAVAPLVAMLRDERWYVVRNMVGILGELRSQECVPSLKRTLYHEDLRVRKETVRALAKIGGESATLLLLPLLEEKDEAVVRQAVLALGGMRSVEAVPPLLKLLERRDLLLQGLKVKKDAAASLGRIGDRRATQPLLRLLGSHGWPVLGRWGELKIAAAAALGALGDEAALPVLTRLARGSGAVAEACRDAVDAVERISGVQV